MRTALGKARFHQATSVSSMQALLLRAGGDMCGIVADGGSGGGHAGDRDDEDGGIAGNDHDNNSGTNARGGGAHFTDAEECLWLRIFSAMERHSRPCRTEPRQGPMEPELMPVEEAVSTVRKVFGHEVAPGIEAVITGAGVEGGAAAGVFAGAATGGSAAVIAKATMRKKGRRENG